MFTSQIYPTSRHFAFIAHFKGFFCFLTVGAFKSVSGRVGAFAVVFGRIYGVTLDLFPATSRSEMDLFKRATFQTAADNNLKINIL